MSKKIEDKPMIRMIILYAKCLGVNPRQCQLIFQKFVSGLIVLFNPHTMSIPKKQYASHSN